ncbi:hypothetical protein KP509_33G016200 [Ceratopteris richardii]|uniref:Uncharacterized protein n=1 Tax=Ceratopteris richardii TaxID=49495 RepID=A0A8T2QNP2_CERRI|nr:hypothetical protein KP509_33G016200 [Ceratopteris richardii]KAH7285171.1 hypothetical protein KP509_33G016200 [Ceratopteris richardii]
MARAPSRMSTLMTDRTETVAREEVHSNRNLDIVFQKVSAHSSNNLPWQHAVKHSVPCASDPIQNRAGTQRAMEDERYEMAVAGENISLLNSNAVHLSAYHGLRTTSLCSSCIGRFSRFSCLGWLRYGYNASSCS